MKGKRQTAVRMETRTVIVGITGAARALGVSRFHLWAVLSGRRQSDGLVMRYESLKRRQAV